MSDQGQEPQQEQEPDQSGVTDRISAAIEDLRGAAESATGEARTKIESAIEKLQRVANAAAGRAQSGVSAVSAKAHETAGEIRGQADSVKDWVRHAGADLLDEAQKEIDKRRLQLRGDSTEVEGEAVEEAPVDGEDPAKSKTDPDTDPPGGVPV